MAVYKPSNCVPFLSCWDLTQNQYISCELNSSNELITGYKIKIFDVDNNLIFEGKEFSPIPETVRITTETQDYTINNTGLNGSTLTLPLIVVSADYSQDNVIYYNNGEWYAKEGAALVEIKNFSNDDANQPYKWQIVLAQGQKMPSTGVFNQEPELKYYDMVIDESKILGSTNNRIQSYLSENIYKDYYIQLYDESNNQLGVRTRISSYDHSYGFIYPQENTIPQELVDRASYFKVFKDTNDPQYVSAARLVNYRVKNDIDKISLNGKTPSTKFTRSGDINVVSNPYFEQVYDGDVTSFITYSAYSENGSDVLVSENSTFLVMYQGAESQRVWSAKSKRVSGTAEIQDITGLYYLSGSFEPEGVNIKNVIASVTIGTRAIASYNQDSNTINYTIYSETKECAAIIRYNAKVKDDSVPMPIDSGSYNANNGVFAFQSATYDSKTNQTTIKWLRPANFNTYSNFINRLICVQSETRNYSTSATAENIGTINQTELMFYPETAIGLYPVYEDGTKNLKVAEVTLANSEIGSPQNFSGGIISSVKVKTQPASATLAAIYLGSNKYVVKVTQGSYTGTVTVDITYMEDRGDVFKNTAGKAYIRPFIGIHAGDKLFYGDKFQETVTINYIDNEPNSGNKYNPTWYITYGENKTFSVGEKYSIRSFFKTSDENPFYAKLSPSLTVSSRQWRIENDGYVKEGEYYVCYKRYITLDGKFEGRNWVNYQWILTDLDMGYVQQSEKIYRGSTQHTFYGLQNTHRYEIQWIVEDEYGIVWESSSLFNVSVSINITPFPLDVTYECDTQSVLINFTRDGIVIPNPWLFDYSYFMVRTTQNPNLLEFIPYLVITNSENPALIEYANFKTLEVSELSLPYKISYHDGYMELGDIERETEFTQNQLMEYTETKLGGTENERGLIPAPLTSDCALNSSHILNANFSGNIISYQIGTDDVGGNKSQLVVTLSVPSSSYIDSNGNIRLQNNRNRFLVTAYKQVGTAKPPISEPIIVNIFKKKGDEWEKVENNEWRTGKEIASAFTKIKGVPETDVDYITTTIPFEYVPVENEQIQNSDYINILEEGAYNSDTISISNPLINVTDNTKSAEGRVWYDRKTRLIQQTSNANTKINVFEAGENGYWSWPTDVDETQKKWVDIDSGEDSSLYEQEEVIGHSGRQDINKVKVTFNIVLKNYNSQNLGDTIDWSSKIIANAFIEDVG